MATKNRPYRASNYPSGSMAVAPKARRVKPKVKATPSAGARRRRL